MALYTRIARLVFLVSFTSVCFYNKIFAQTLGSATISGIVLSADGKPAPYLTIGFQKIKLKTLTNKDGHFSFEHLPALNDTLLIKGIGFKPWAKLIKVSNAQTLLMGTIRLEYAITQLQDVEIIGRLAHSYKSDYSFFGNKTETPLKDIPQSISTVTKELISDKMEFMLKDAVDEVAGVNQYSGYDEYTIRGFRAENAHTINGLRGYNSTYTSSMLVNVERIEVIKGPTATLYGNCDPGGTINLVTKKPLNTTEADIEMYAGSWNHYRMQGDITGPLKKSKTLFYRMNAGYDNTKSFRNGLFAKSYELAPSVSFIANPHLQVNADLSLSHVNTVLDRGQPGFSTDSTFHSTPIRLSIIQPGDYLHETDLAAVVAASYKFNKKLSISTGFLHYNTWQYVAEHGLDNYITPDSVFLYYTKWRYKTTTNTLSSYLTYNFKSGKATHQVVAGYDFIRSAVNLHQQYGELPAIFGEGSGIAGTFSLKQPQYINRNVKAYDFEEEGNDAAAVDASVYQTQGLYVQEQVSIKKWKLLLGMREEFYEGGDEEDSITELEEHIFLPRTGLVYAVNSNISVYATYNKGFDPFEASTSLQIFDAPFKPVISELLEAGIKANLFKNKLTTSLAVYQLTLKNVAVNANSITNPNLFIQEGKGRSVGVEAEAAGNPLSNLSITLSYAYCNSKIIESTDPLQLNKPLENVPRHSSNSWMKYVLPKGPLKGLGFTAGHTQQSMRNTLTPGLQLPSFCVFNAGLLYTAGHTSIAFTVNNITNETYWGAAYNNVNKWPGAPRNGILRIGYKF